MRKLKVGVIFGGISSEHDVSKVSGTSVICNLDKEKYDIVPIYIDQSGKWYRYQKKIEEIEILKIDDDISKDLERINNVGEVLQSLDVAFPVLHGLGGEDGSIQGVFELLNIPYVGCGILASSIGMDKAYSKIVFEKAGIKQAKYVYIRKYHDQYIYVDKQFHEKRMHLREMAQEISNYLPYPMFVKPSNSGSSVGINKANNLQELEEAIEYASQFDKKILIEEQLKGKEVECAVLGVEDVTASCVGEIKPAEEFYTFDAKYNNAESKVLIPASISEEMSNKIRTLAVKAFKAIDGKRIIQSRLFCR